MGNIQSNVTKQTLSNYTNVVNNTVANVFNSAVQTCAASNYFTLETGGGPDCPFEAVDSKFDIKQTAGSTCKLDSVNINNLTATFKTELINNTRQFIQQESQNKQGWFATALSLQLSQASTVEEIVTQISNNFTANFNNNCSSVATAFNDAKVKLCGYFNLTEFNVGQNSLVNSLTSCVNQNTMNIWTSNSVLNNLWQQTDQKLASQQSGTFDLKWLFIGIAGIIALILIILAIVLLTRGKKSSPKTIDTDFE